jgi:hypothetical protein
MMLQRAMSWQHKTYTYKTWQAVAPSKDMIHLWKHKIRTVVKNKESFLYQYKAHISCHQEKFMIAKATTNTALKSTWIFLTHGH